MQTINSFLAYVDYLARVVYHVNPLILLTIYIISIPFFYLSLYKVVAELWRFRKGTADMRDANILKQNKLIYWSIILFAVFISPYAYIFAFGENIPIWLAISLVVIVLASLLGVLRMIKERLDEKTK